MISGVPVHQRSTHTNYLIYLLKSALFLPVQQRGPHYTDTLFPVKPVLHLHDNPNRRSTSEVGGAHYTRPSEFVKLASQTIRHRRHSPFDETAALMPATNTDRRSRLVTRDA